VPCARRARTIGMCAPDARGEGTTIRPRWVVGQESVRVILRCEEKELLADARPQVRKNRRRIRWNTLRIVSGRERRRCCRSFSAVEWYYSDRLLGKRKIRKKSRMLAPARDPKMKTVRRASIQVHEYQKLNNAMWTDPIGPSLRRQCLLRCFSWVLSSVSD
jgi:hypothetical protein